MICGSDDMFPSPETPEDRIADLIAQALVEGIMQAAEDRQKATGCTKSEAANAVIEEAAQQARLEMYLRNTLGLMD